MDKAGDTKESEHYRCYDEIYRLVQGIQEDLDSLKSYADALTGTFGMKMEPRDVLRAKLYQQAVKKLAIKLCE